MNSYRVEASLTVTTSGRVIVENLSVNLIDGMDPKHTAEDQLLELGYTEDEILHATFNTIPL
jgi:hypothetical protein